MPDDQNVPVGGAGQTHSARVKFASDTVREKVGELLAEAGGNLAPVDAEERQRVARRLRKAKGAAPLNLLPLLTLLLAACGRTPPEFANEFANEGTEAEEAPPEQTLASASASAGASAGAGGQAECPHHLQPAGDHHHPDRRHGRLQYLGLDRGAA